MNQRVSNNMKKMFLKKQIQKELSNTVVWHVKLPENSGFPLKVQ